MAGKLFVMFQGYTKNAIFKQLLFLSSSEDMLIDFRERRREGEREGNIDVREKHQSVASRTHPDGD